MDYAIITPWFPQASDDFWLRRQIALARTYNTDELSIRVIAGKL